MDQQREGKPKRLINDSLLFAINSIEMIDFLFIFIVTSVVSVGENEAVVIERFTALKFITYAFQ